MGSEGDEAEVHRLHVPAFARTAVRNLATAFDHYNEERPASATNCS